MKNLALNSLAFVLLLTALWAARVRAESAQTLDGEFDWGVEHGRLQAVFTPRNVPGESRWNVEFRFRIQGQSHVYKGTADGELDAGELAGAVRTDDDRRTFTFRGEFRDGTFRGVHAELRNGRESRTGTLTLSRPSGSETAL